MFYSNSVLEMCRLHGSGSSTGKSELETLDAGDVLRGTRNLERSFSIATAAI